MKKVTYALLFSLFLGLGSLFSTNFAVNSISAQEIQLDIGKAAQEQGVVGTENIDAEDAGFGILIGRILNIITVVATLLLIFYLIWGGIEWITSGGDKGKTESARNKMTQAVIGIIVLAGSIAIFTLLQGFLGIEVLNFTNSDPLQTELGITGPDPDDLRNLPTRR